MKKNGFYVYTAIIAVFMHYYNAETLAKTVIELSGKNSKYISISDARASGIVFKKRRECDISIDEMKKILKSASKKLIKSDIDTFESTINDKYEVDYHEDIIDDNFIEEIFTITDNPKYMYIEIDFN